MNDPVEKQQTSVSLKNMWRSDLCVYTLFCLLPGLAIFFGLLFGLLLPEVNAVHNTAGWCTILPPGGQVVTSRGCNSGCYNAIFLVSFQQNIGEPWTARTAMNEFDNYPAAISFISSHPVNSTSVCYLDAYGKGTFSQPKVSDNTIAIFTIFGFLFGILPIFLTLVNCACEIHYYFWRRGEVLDAGGMI